MWIDVKEQMPPENIFVLAFDQSKEIPIPLIAKWKSDRGWTGPGFGIKSENVTHWQALTRPNGSVINRRTISGNPGFTRADSQHDRSWK